MPSRPCSSTPATSPSSTTPYAKRKYPVIWSMPIIRWFSIAYIEVVRGVPLITILFMAQLMLPLFLPTGWTVDRVIRAMVGITLFSAAYLAENVRGGLQAIPKGQFEAAGALGLAWLVRWMRTA